MTEKQTSVDAEGQEACSWGVKGCANKLSHAHAAVFASLPESGEEDLRRAPECSCDAASLRKGLSALWCNADCTRRFPINAEARPSRERALRQALEKTLYALVQLSKAPSAHRRGGGRCDHCDARNSVMEKIDLIRAALASSHAATRGEK